MVACQNPLLQEKAGPILLVIVCLMADKETNEIIKPNACGTIKVSHLLFIIQACDIHGTAS